MNLINFALLISKTELETIVEPIITLCGYIVPVMLAVVGSLGAIWCIILGMKYAKADEPQEHEKAKNGLKNAIIGFVLIFILLIMLQVGIDIFTEWYSSY